MPVNRREILESLIAQNPNDPFARYGLAMEYKNSGELEKAVEAFEALITAKPDYAAAYFHGGQTLENLGRAEAARAIYLKGIDVTTRIGDSHTRSEIQAALDMLG